MHQQRRPRARGHRGGARARHRRAGPAAWCRQRGALRFPARSSLREGRGGPRDGPREPRTRRVVGPSASVRLSREDTRLYSLFPNTFSIYNYTFNLERIRPLIRVCIEFRCSLSHSTPAHSIFGGGERELARLVRNARACTFRRALVCRRCSVCTQKRLMVWKWATGW